jgi:hypothetical protein
VPEVALTSFIRLPNFGRQEFEISGRIDLRDMTQNEENSIAYGTLLAFRTGRGSFIIASPVIFLINTETHPLRRGERCKRVERLVYPSSAKRPSVVTVTATLAASNAFRIDGRQCWEYAFRSSSL